MDFTSPWMTIAHYPHHTRVTSYPNAFQKGTEPGKACKQPQFVTMVGKKTKSAILRTISCAPNDPLLRVSHGQVYIRNDTISDRALCYIDCEAHIFKPKHIDSARGAGPSSKIDVPSYPSARSFGNIFCSRVLAPLSTLVCYFAADLGGLRGVAKLLAEQLLNSIDTDMPSQAQTGILVIAATTATTFEQAVAELKIANFVRQFADAETRGRNPKMDAKIDRLCSVLRVVGFHAGLSLQNRTKIFRRTVSAISSARAASRCGSGMAFSANHAESLFSSLLRHFSSQSQDEFSYISASRPQGFGVGNFSRQLSKLLQAMPSEAYLWHSVVPHVAAALLLASFPPDSHCECTSIRSTPVEQS